ncbi:hydrolase or acyltransferase [Arthrobacter crystallopoietes BAB-32]|uniref:Hydrolase or acyltransferase n=1 Tax=Arthrobacter crystallopoietes BAB-32 TaxID=1246476 RepID=N1UW28_9MICC|nr:alpha/beta hydrolase [Arthrobacter crystallopoietes]EMY33250.1 hydrolase or acyltransferase [Arthrobacter crystallopoietes BAB-32]
MTLLDGISSRRIATARLNVNLLERLGDRPDGIPVVLVHGNISSALFWQELMLRLQAGYRPIAVDLRGFGDTDPEPVDATRGLADFSDDLAATLDALELPAAHLVGWSMGGGVVLQYALDRPVLSLTLQAPVSPYGFGGTAGPDGRRLTDDDAGCGGGGVNPDFVARLKAGDRTAEAPTSPLNVYRAAYVHAGYSSPLEDLWLESMLSTRTGEDHYPGDAMPSGNWPGFAAGKRGIANAMAPGHFNVSAIVDLPVKPDVLWVRGDADAIVSDASFFDTNQLGKAGVIAGWPGEEAAPPQPMVAQTRAVLEEYAARGGTSREVVLPNCGHSPHLEYPAEFLAELTAHIEAASDDGN